MKCIRQGARPVHPPIFKKDVEGAPADGYISLPLLDGSIL